MPTQDGVQMCGRNGWERRGGGGHSSPRARDGRGMGEEEEASLLFPDESSLRIPFPPFFSFPPVLEDWRRGREGKEGEREAIASNREKMDEIWTGGDARGRKRTLLPRRSGKGGREGKGGSKSAMHGMAWLNFILEYESCRVRLSPEKDIFCCRQCGQSLVDVPFRMSRQ